MQKYFPRRDRANAVFRAHPASNAHALRSNRKPSAKARRRTPKMGLNEINGLPSRPFVAPLRGHRGCMGPCRMSENVRECPKMPHLAQRAQNEPTAEKLVLLSAGPRLGTSGVSAAIRCRRMRPDTEPAPLDASSFPRVTVMTDPIRIAFACLALAALAALAPPARGETIKLATYNIEHWHSNFEGHRLQMSTRPARGAGSATQPVSPQMIEIIDEERRQNDEDHWEVSQVILDPAFAPDVLVVQEGCRQNDLEFFNKRWLNGAFATVIQFPSNTDREQHLCMLLKP